MIRFLLAPASLVYISLAAPYSILGSPAMGTLHAEDQHTSMAKLRGLRGDDFCQPVCSRSAAILSLGISDGTARLPTNILGKGKLRGPWRGLSVLTIFLWFAAAPGE